MTLHKLLVFSYSFASLATREGDAHVRATAHEETSPALGTGRSPINTVRFVSVPWEQAAHSSRSSVLTDRVASGHARDVDSRSSCTLAHTASSLRAGVTLQAARSKWAWGSSVAAFSPVRREPELAAETALCLISCVSRNVGR